LECAGEADFSAALRPAHVRQFVPTGKVCPCIAVTATLNEFFPHEHPCTFPFQELSWRWP
jgi:hypothetical protein